MIDLPEQSPDQDAQSLALLHRVGLERQDLGQRLSQHEFRALCAELKSARMFDHQIELGTSEPPVPLLPELAMDDDHLSGLPTLSVPLGRIAWVQRPQELPVTGILLEHDPDAVMAEALTVLMTEHHRKPFSRLVFLCRGLSPVPFLGRYGFLCHFIAETALEDVGRVMTHRYGMSQIRLLVGGRKLWSDG